MWKSVRRACDVCLLDLSINILDYSFQFTDGVHAALKWLQDPRLPGWKTEQISHLLLVYIPLKIFVVRGIQ